jgi:hypothetical protein
VGAVSEGGEVDSLNTATQVIVATRKAYRLWYWQATA